MSTQYCRANWRLTNVTWEAINSKWNCHTIDGGKFTTRFRDDAGVEWSLGLMYLSRTQEVSIELYMNALDVPDDQSFPVTLNAYLKCGNNIWQIENRTNKIDQEWFYRGGMPAYFKYYGLSHDLISIEDFVEKLVDANNFVEFDIVVSFSSLFYKFNSNFQTF